MEQSRNDKELHVFGRPLKLLFVILYKGVWGLVEVVAGGGALLFYHLIREELSEDPQDLLVHWIVSHVSSIQLRYIGVGILMLGIFKIILAIGLWYRSWRLRKAAMILFGASSLFALYHLCYAFSWWKLALLLAELSILYYFWKVLPRHFQSRG